jgi:hypothetical protein
MNKLNTIPGQLPALVSISRSEKLVKEHKSGCKSKEERAAKPDAVCGCVFRAAAGAAWTAKHRNWNEQTKERLLSFGNR